MQSIETIPGKNYSVHTASGCTVSDDSGWSKEIGAPDGYFTAHGSTVYLSDDEASVREVFKLAPVVGGSGGGGLPKTDYLIYNSDYTEVSGNLDNLENRSHMFYGCTSLTTFTADLPVLTNGPYMFYGCTSLKSWDIDLPKLTSGSYMFCDCTSLKSWDIDLPVLTDGSYMFRNCTSLTTFTADLPVLTRGSYMFSNCTSLKSWDIDLPVLTDQYQMFYGCTSLKSWDIDLPKLTSGAQMFSRCTALTTFTADLPVLTSGAYMFSNCTSLKSWDIDLPKLTDGGYIFYDCTALTTFTADLPVLTDGSNMFRNCQLDKESALRILNSISAYASGTHRLTIGIHVDHQTDEEVLAAIANAEAKRWTLTVQWNGTATSAASVMRFGQLIYAKVSEHELPNGTTDRVLDWGHYVTDETGYETFRSLESAYEYFGLPMPEES